MKFFEEDPPIFTKGTDEKVCWPTFAYDHTAKLPVKVWDAAFRVLCGIAAARLRELWESGLKCEELQEGILKELNANANNEFLMSCSANVWVSGGKEKTHTPQVNINAVEIIEKEDA